MNLETIEKVIKSGSLGEDCQGNRLYLEVTSEMIDWLIVEINQWRTKFHDRCEIQLDEFRKDGMTDAAERCVELSNDCTTVYEATAAIEREFKL